MDKIDIQILHSLQKDGRTPFTKIAKETGVSESTIRSRYANLVEEGVVNTVSIVDPFAVGFQAPAIIGVTVETGKHEEVANLIKNFPEVSYLVMVLGAFDLIVEVYCQTLPHFIEFITNNLHNIPGIRNTEIFMIGKMYKLSYRWSPDFDSHFSE